MQLAQSRNTLGNDVLVGREDVVRQNLPVREVHDLKIRREVADLFFEAQRRAGIRGDNQCQPRVFSRSTGQCHGLGRTRQLAPETAFTCTLGEFRV